MSRPSRTVVCLSLALAGAWPGAALAQAQDRARSAASRTLAASVSHVVDGDSVWLRRQDNGRRMRARLDGIDAPELCQRFGPEARQALRALVADQPLQVTVRAYDGYRRAIVRLKRGRDGMDVAARLVADGWAWSAPGFRGRPGLYAEQQVQARRAGRGLFVDETPLPPADFRRQHGPCPAPPARGG